MSGTQVSSAPNVLFDPLMARRQTALDTENQNQLLQQQTTRQEIGGRDIEMGARLASSLLNLDEPTAAQAYSQALPGLQAQGYLKNAPSVYPGHAAALRLAQMGTPSATLYTYGQNQQANAAILGAGTPGATGATAPPPATMPGTTSPGATIGQRQNNPGNLTFAGQPGASPGQGNRFASFPDMPTGVAANANQLALYQTQHGINTVRDAVTRWVSDPKADLTSYIGDIAKALGVGPDDKIDLTDPAVQAKFIQAQFPHESAGGGYVLNPADVQKGVQMAAAQRGQRTQVAATPAAPQQAAAQPQGGPGAPPAPPPTQFAGPGAPPPPGPTAPPAATPPPGTNALAPQPVGTQGLVRNEDGSVGTPNAGGLATPQPQQQAQGQQPAPLPQPTAPPPPGTLPFQPVQRTLSLPQTDAEGLTANDRAALNALGRAPGTTPQQLLERKTALQNVNQQRVKDVQAQANAELQQQIELQRLQNPMQSRAVEGEATWDGSKWAPTTPGQEGTPGKWVYAGNQRVAFEPASTRPAQADYNLQKEQLDKDAERLPEYNTQNQQAGANIIRIQQMRELVDQITSGAGGAERANWANIADTMGWHDLAKRLIGMGGAAAAQEFAKYGLATAGAQERGDLGARGSLGAITLYKSANPGLELQTDANKKMLTAQLIAAQANRDYTEQAMKFVSDNGRGFWHGKEYTPLREFDTQWAASRNPQIYAAAMGAINGDSWDKWTKALNMKSPDDVQRVIDIVRRADPTSTILFKDNERHAVTVQ